MGEYRVNPDSGLPEDPAMLAYTMSEAAADGLGEQSTEYLAEVVQELFAIAPAVREAVDLAIRNQEEDGS